MSIVLVFVTGAMYAATSAGLIAFNKHLMTPGMFPFPVALGLLHAVFCSTMCGILYLAKPGLFPALSDPNKNAAVKDGSVIKAVLPLACFASAQIILSNQAYLFTDVAFLQMMKECNVVGVYFMSVIFALEVFQWRHLQLIVLILFATWLTVIGELNFSMIAFALQAGNFFMESLKITLQGVMLSSKGQSLDALSYVLLMMPPSAVILAGITASFHFLLPNQQFVLMPATSDWINMKGFLLANACLAFVLNVSIALFIKYSSPMAFALAAIFKDGSIVLVGVLFMGKKTTATQLCGFALQVSLVLTWSLMKVFPKAFEHGILEGLHMVATGRHHEQLKSKDAEQAPETCYGSVHDAPADALLKIDKPKVESA